MYYDEDGENWYTKKGKYIQSLYDKIIDWKYSTEKKLQQCFGIQSKLIWLNAIFILHQYGRKISLWKTNTRQIVKYVFVSKDEH